MVADSLASDGSPAGDFAVTIHKTKHNCGENVYTWMCLCVCDFWLDVRLYVVGNSLGQVLGVVRAHLVHWSL